MFVHFLKEGPLLTISLVFSSPNSNTLTQHPPSFLNADTYWPITACIAFSLGPLSCFHTHSRTHSPSLFRSVPLTLSVCYSVCYSLSLNISLSLSLNISLSLSISLSISLFGRSLFIHPATSTLPPFSICQLHQTVYSSLV